LEKHETYQGKGDTSWRVTYMSAEISWTMVKTRMSQTLAEKWQQL